MLPAPANPNGLQNHRPRTRPCRTGPAADLGAPGPAARPWVTPSRGGCLSPDPDLTRPGESWVTNARKGVMINEREERQAVEVYLRGSDPEDPLASPFFANLRGLPPVHLQVGSYEVLRSDVERFADKAREAGVEAILEVWQACSTSGSSPRRSSPRVGGRSRASGRSCRRRCDGPARRAIAPATLTGP